MKAKIERCNIPNSSQISKSLSGAYYSDAYCFPTKYRERTSLQIWLAHVSTVPAWVNFLMAARNKLVSALGLKNLGHLGAVDEGKPINNYRVGDRVGIFTILSLSDNEIVLGDSDKHLDVKVSVFKDINDSEFITISTVVHVHNALGKTYMLVVEPMHKLIVPSTIKRAEFSDIKG
ncbi:MAG: DUF2867 domain-containing protein [Moritella sp.]|uniref:DUF2867 domain-containing protein n=1 Tax=Moritella sp. TaxID=78556 RepID=UPI0025E37E0F|nr:DUF2867 domain-containing protein [Moritella sp.]NQZ90979.1 DUF2867 domain-containing protein [Moritella sp.]